MGCLTANVFPQTPYLKEVLVPMQQIEVVSFFPTRDPLFRVVYTPSGKKRRRELLVVGAVLSKITGLDCFTPFTTYRLEPAFIFGNDVVLGASYWDSERDGGEIIVTPVRKVGLCQHFVLHLAKGLRKER